MNILALYNSSIFQDFEIFLTTEIDLNNHDIRLFLLEYNSNFVTCEITQGIHTSEDLSEVLLGNSQLGLKDSTTRLILSLKILA